MFYTFFSCLWEGCLEFINNTGVISGILKGFKSLLRMRPCRSNETLLVCGNPQLSGGRELEHSKVTCVSLGPCVAPELREGTKRKRRWMRDAPVCLPYGGSMISWLVSLRQSVIIPQFSLPGARVKGYSGLFFLLLLLVLRRPIVGPPPPSGSKLSLYFSSCDKARGHWGC
jgi:hypothetical protein